MYSVVETKTDDALWHKQLASRLQRQHPCCSTSKTAPCLYMGKQWLASIVFSGLKWEAESEVEARIDAKRQRISQLSHHTTAKMNCISIH